MPTQAEEQQTKEFLKRAEIRTMKKDLQNLREADALKERRKIVNVKTLEEQRLEEEKKMREKEEAEERARKAGLEKVLLQNAEQERLAEKDLKAYATEQERQQVFLLESQRVSFENEVDLIDKEKDPALKLEKNKLLLKKGDIEEKLRLIKEDTKKLDTEENFLNEKVKQSQNPLEKRGFEERRWEIEDQRRGLEKKTWESEKQLKNIEKETEKIDGFSEQLVTKRNELNQKILGIDKSLRGIYSGVIERVEEKRRLAEEAKKTGAGELAKARAEEKEKIQRQQWTKIPVPVKGEIILKDKLARSFEAEKEQRKKFLKDVEENYEPR